MGLISTPAAGTLQPGTWQNNKSGCWLNHQGFVRFKSPATGSFWWSPGPGVVSATITDTSTNNPVNRRIDVMESGTLKHFCDTRTPGSVTFPVKSTSKYQIIDYVINTSLPPDSNGETITLNVDGLQ